MSKRAKNEFAVMKLFLDVLPVMDESALAALLGWLEARGKEELEKRKRTAPPPASSE